MQDVDLVGLTSGKNNATQNNNTAIVNVTNAAFIMNSGTVSGNNSYGVYVSDSTFCMAGGTVYGEHINLTSFTTLNFPVL